MIKNIGFLGLFFFFCWSGYSIEKDFSTARQSLEKLLQNYKADSFIIPLRQDLFLSILKMNLTNQGKIYIKGEKFRLDLKGNPSNLSVFDGVFLWYQPDLKEKLVFKIKNPSEVQKISTFFEIESLLNKLELIDFVQKKPFKVYHFKPKKKIQGLKEIFMKSNGKWIVEMRFIWDDLNTWQKYTLSKPVLKKNPSQLFEWTQKEYRILEKEVF